MKKIQTIMKIDIAFILIGLVNWLKVMYDSYGGKLDLANTILVYGILICSMLAIFYILVGCNKQYGSTIYKVFINIYALIELSTLIKHVYQTPFEVITTALRFATLVLLSEAKDLGEKKSKIIALIPIATTVADLIEIGLQGGLPYAWKGIFIEVMLEISILLFVIAKYKDKKERKKQNNSLNNKKIR